MSATEKLNQLFIKYGNGSNPYVRFLDAGSYYMMIVNGGRRQNGRERAFLFDKGGTTIGGTRNRWFPPSEVNDNIEIYSPPAFSEPEEPETPETPVNLDTITNDYNTTTGYGEVDVEGALEELLNIDLPSQPDAALQEDNRFDLYGMDRINAPEAWAAGYTGDGIIVAVLDTGVDTDHVDLDDNIWVNEDEIAGDGIDNDNNGFIDDVEGWNTAAETNDVSDTDGHGTHVAGTIAAERNGIGVVGAAYDVKIMPVKVFNDTEEGSYIDLAEGIYYAVDNGAHVINMSLGGGTVPPQIIQDAIDYANNNGVICVMAAGNDAGLAPLAPGSYASEYGIVVGAIDQNGNIASFSNRAGGATDWNSDGFENPLYVTASGVAIFSTFPGDQIASLQGTSMATPIVAAAVAILLQADPTLTPDQIRVLLANTTK